MKVFVTGHCGYIGAHLVDLLKEAGHEVTGCDLGLFDGTEWEPVTAPDQALRKDVRDVEETDLEGHDCVMHLAAISNDPMGELDSGITASVNGSGSVRLAERAKRAGVGRFLFASSCSMYGRADRLDLDEEAPLNPVSAYARSKIDAERGIAALAGDGFSPVFLRNATAYGHSPMLRIDLVVNNLLACAVARGEIRVMSDGTPWRPLIHCRDIARAFLEFLEAPAGKVHNRSVNVGANAENHQVRDIAERVRRLVPGAQIRFTGEVGEDPRNYRVDFGRLGELLPKFRLEYDLDRGMEELHRAYRDHGFSAADFDGGRFVRLSCLKSRLHLLRADPVPA
jgi:nucleoside-diphosphate-sugar epimerase